MGRYGSGFDNARMASFLVQQDEVRAQLQAGTAGDPAATALVRFLSRLLPKKRYDEAAIIATTRLPGVAAPADTSPNDDV